MSKFVRSGGSFNYVCCKAEMWFKNLKPSEISLDRTLSVVTDAYAIADSICNILDLPLHQVISQAHGRLTATAPLLTLHSGVERRGDELCRHIPNDSTRWTARSRSQWGYRILRFIATLARTKDLNLIQVLTSPAPVNAGDSAAELKQDESKESKKQEAIDNEFEAGPGADGDGDNLGVFRAALVADGDLSPEGASSFLPQNYGLDLQGLRRLTNLLLGSVKQRGSVAHDFEPAAPWLVEIDLDALRVASLPTSKADARSAPSASGAHPIDGAGDPKTVPLVLFPRPQWRFEESSLSADWFKRYKAAVAAVKRKKITVLECDHTPHYDYGVLRRGEDAFCKGQSIIVTGISGTGKSTYLSKLPTLGATVFEVGTDNFTAGPDRLHYRMDELEEMVRKARRTPGRKLLVCHEFFISKEFLPRLGVFDQFAIAGDPRQPGAGDARHLLDFIRDIGGLQLTLPVVWRAGNVLSTMVVNYFAYGSQFRICERRVTLEDPQFNVIEADDSMIAIAKSMVVYALQRAALGKTVIIAASCSDLVASVELTMRALRNAPAKIQCRLLSDLQGREADVVVFDLHDVATCYPEPDEALRYCIMLLGRARLSTCVVLRKCQYGSDIKLAQPIKVIFGVLLRYRLRSREKKVLQRSGPSFKQFSCKYELFLLDEETIRVRSVKHFISVIAIVKSRSSHNAAMLKDHSCVIEEPCFFDEAADLEAEVRVIEQLLSGEYQVGMYSIAELRQYIVKRGRSIS